MLRGEEDLNEEKGQNIAAGAFELGAALAILDDTTLDKFGINMAGGRGARGLPSNGIYGFGMKMADMFEKIEEYAKNPALVDQRMLRIATYGYQTKTPTGDDLNEYNPKVTKK